MITLGIDPGTALLGFGVVESGDDPRLIDYGAIATRSDRLMPDRLNELFEAMTSLLDEHRPEVVAVEQLFFARNVTTAIAVGQARGVILLAAARSKVTVVEY